MSWSYLVYVDALLNDSTHRDYLLSKLVIDPNVSPYNPTSTTYSTPETFVINFDTEITNEYDLESLLAIVNIIFYNTSPTVFPMRNAFANYSPTTSHDHDSDFAVSSVWVNTTTNVAYTCYDNTNGSALWLTAPAINPATLDGTTIQYSTDTNSWVTVPGNWDSTSISCLNMYKAGVSDPSFNNIISGLSTLLFDHAATQELFFDFVLPPNYKENSDVTVVVHYVPTTSNSGDVVWGIEYSWLNPGGVFASSSTINLISATNSISLEHLQPTFAAFNGSGKTISGIIKCRIFRNGTSINDTYPDQAGLLFAELKFNQSGTGSANMTSK